MSAFSRTLVTVADTAAVRHLVTRTRAGKSLVRRFVAGETLDEAVTVARELNSRGLSVSLDLLGEEVFEAEAVEAAVKGYEQCLERITKEGLDGNISIKLTQLGLAFDQDLARDGLERLAASANRLGLTVTIDMEDSRYTESTISLFERAQPRHGNLGLALQAYLLRTPDDLKRVALVGGHVRLCKGAYLEPPEVAFQSPDDVDAAFARLLEALMIETRVRPAIATHDPRLIALAKLLAAGEFEYQMLYGVRPSMQGELVSEGYEMRVYVPYGVAWYPYLVRRLAERPANLGFFLRALLTR